MKKQAQKFDIIVIGGGPAGLSFARAVADTGLQIAVIERSPKKVLEKPPYDGRETALTHLSKRIMGELGMWDLLGKNDVSLIKKAHVINGESPYALRFSHEDAGEETLGYMVSNENIRRTAFASLKGFKNITLMDGKSVQNLETDTARGRVELDDGGVLEAALIVAADSRFSATRRMMGIQTDMKDLGRTCIVGVMKHSKPHHDTAFECFHYDRTLAVLPLNNGLVSIVITLPSDQADDLLSMSREDFARDIEERFEHRVGTMEMEGKLHPYPLVCNYANSFVARRYALLGDAAVGMHPVTAHGFNLGLRGGDTLAREVRTMVETGGDIGSSVVLGNYNRAHNRVCKPLYLGTNAIVKLYTDTRPAAKIVRKGLLHLGNLLRPANKLITAQLTESKAS